MNDVGTLNYFFWYGGHRRKYFFDLIQRKYAPDIISETGLSGSKPAVALIKKNNQLAKVTGSFLSLLDRYRRLVRHLIYLTITRPEMAYVVHNLPQFITNPNKTTGMLHYELLDI